MNHRPILTLALLAFASAPAFAQSTTSANDNSARATREQAPPPPPEQSTSREGTAEAYASSGGSLLRAGRGVSAASGGAGAGPASSVDPRIADISLFVVPPPQRRVIRPHSLITIVVREQSEFKSDGTSSLEKKASLTAEINQFLKFNLANQSLTNAIGGVAPHVDLNGDSKFDGKGSAERTDSLSVRMQAEVVDVKPNGNLVLQARRRLKTDDEEQIFQVSGIARVEDITTDNTILSTQMYDFDLNQQTKGTVHEATKRGWLPRLLDAINPF